MLVRHHPRFDVHYKKRIAPLVGLNRKFKERMNLFLLNPQHPVLKDHPLKGSRNLFRAFSITGDLRVIYRRINKDEVILMDVGSHNQVY